MEWQISIRSGRVVGFLKRKDHKAKNVSTIKNLIILLQRIIFERYNLIFSRLASVHDNILVTTASAYIYTVLILLYSGITVYTAGNLEVYNI